MGAFAYPRHDTLHFFTTSRIWIDADGVYTTNTSPMARREWVTYLEHFSNVRIYGRVSLGSGGAHVLNHPRIEVVPIPDYKGLGGYLRVRGNARRFFESQIVSDQDLYALWVPNGFQQLISRCVKRAGSRLLAVVVGDPYEVMLSVLPRPVARVGAVLARRSMRRTIHDADAVIYVTLNDLQRKYPARPQSLTLARSDVDFELLRDLWDCRDYEMTKPGQSGWISIVAVGSQDQNYKGHDILIEALARLQHEGFRIHGTVIGQGRLHEALVQQAHDAGISDVAFVENVGDSKDVASLVAKHDLFVMPSRTEGMPKALLEAMAVGVVAVGSRVGGIPEVLSDDCLFDPDSVESLVSLLRKALEDPDWISRKSPEQHKRVSDVRLNHSGHEVLTNFLGEWVS